jgi:hypothetical protein
MFAACKNSSGLVGRCGIIFLLFLLPALWP